MTLNPSPNDETLPLSLSATAPMTQEPLRRIGEYELLAEIARGGMGIVYRARHVTLNRLVAVKMIRQMGMASSVERQRFTIEAEAVAALEHPNIVPIFDVGELDGQPYFAMKLIDGGSLHDALHSPDWKIGLKSNIRQSVAWMREIAQAVHYAHQQGIIHRDLKPRNILVDKSNHLFVADFGLAKRLESDDGQTQTGALIGTPEYMSPEQMMGKSAGVQSDIYSLGTILYRMLAGRTPFHSDSTPELFQFTLHQPVPSLRKLNQQVNKDLETICLKCLEKQPAQRYGSAFDFAQDLERWERGDPVRARPLGPIIRSIRWARSRPVNMAIAMLSCLLLVVVSLALWAGYHSTQSAFELYREQWRETTIRMAADALEIGESIDAERFLTQVEERRGDKPLPWEWHYLRNKIPIAFRLPVPNRCYSSLSPNGMLAVVEEGMPTELGKLSFWDRENSNESPIPKFKLAHQKALVSPSFVLRSSNRTSWSPDGNRLAMNLFSDVEVWNSQTGVLEWEIPFDVTNTSGAIAWKDDGSQLAIARKDIEIYDVSSKSRIRSFQVNNSQVVHSVAWVANSQKLAVSLSNSTQFFDAHTFTEDQTWDFSVIAWSPNHIQWVSRNGIGNTESGRLTHEVALNETARWSPDGNLIAYYNGDGVFVIRASDGKLVKRFQGVANGSISWFPDSSRLVVGNQILEDFNWNVNDSLIAQPESIEHISAFPEGTRAAVVLDGSNHILVIDSRGTVESRFVQHSQPVKHLHISEDNDTVASIDNSGIVCVWSSNDGSLIARWSELAGGERTGTDSSAPVVFLSPDNQYCAASFNGKTMAWQLGTLLPKYTLELKGASVIGWSKTPLALQIYTGFEKPSEPIRQRRAIKSPEFEKYDYMVSWEPEKNAEHRYTLYIDSLFQEQKRPQWIGSATYEISAGNSNESAGFFISGTRIYCISLESHSRHVDQLSSSIPARQGTLPCSFGTDRFAYITPNGYLRLWERNEKLFWTFPTKYSPTSHLSYSSGRLWVADGKQIHVLNGASRQLSEHKETSWLKWRVEEPLFGLFLPGTFLLVIPAWLWLDRGIRISQIAKWLINALSISLGIVLIQQTPASIQLSPLLLSLLLLGNLLIGIGIAAFLLEPFRLLSVGKWKLPLVLALFTLSAIFIMIVYKLWPKPWAIESQQALLDSFFPKFSMLLALWTTGSLFLAFRVISSRTTPTIINVPTWVRVGMWQTGSMFELLLGTTFALAAGIGIMILLNQLHVFPDEVRLLLKIILIPLAPLFFAAGCFELYVAIWLVRNGGWKAHVINKVELMSKGENLGDD